MIIKKEDENIILPEGEPINEGDLIVIHPSENGEWVTHGNSRIAEGDTVVIVRLRDGDLAALNGAVNAYRDCKVLQKVKHDTSEHNYSVSTDDWWYREYKFQMWEEDVIKRDPESIADTFPKVNIRMDFRIEYNDDAFQSFWPYGAVWIGVSQDDKEYWWCQCFDPHLVLSAKPWAALGATTTPLCVENFFGACLVCCPPPHDIREIRFWKIHIRHQSSMYWVGHNKTELLYFTICQGEPKPGWCSDIDTFDIRDALTD